MVDLQRAYAACLRDARGHCENFPVASVLIPRHMRNQVAALYAFARAADDFADEGDRSVAERERLLDGWLRRLRAASATPPGPPPAPGEPAHAQAIFVALGASIDACDLPLSLLEDLLSAFRQDVHVARYESWNDLFDYCRRSANPVGRLVLRIAGYRDPRLDAWSDAICTALQLTNFWQDAAIDAARGRIYLPLRELRAHGVDPGAPPAGAAGWPRAIAAAVARTQALFDEGRPLCDAVRGRLRYELRATWLGGMRILARLEAGGFDPFARRPALGLADVPWMVWQAAVWRGPAQRTPLVSSAAAPREADDGTR